jgi:hypothetical protein
LLNDKELIHVKVLDSLLSLTKCHSIDDTKKLLHTNILNLILILLDYFDLSVNIATKIKVYSFQVIDKYFLFICK